MSYYSTTPNPLKSPIFGGKIKTLFKWLTRLYMTHLFTSSDFTFFYSSLTPSTPARLSSFLYLEHAKDAPPLGVCTCYGQDQEYSSSRYFHALFFSSFWAPSLQHLSLSIIPHNFLIYWFSIYSLSLDSQFHEDKNTSEI